MLWGWNSGIDLDLFYLDDGVLAGDVPAVAAALAQTQRRAAELGLRLNLRKCEVVATGDIAVGDLVGHLPDALLRRTDGSSRLLRNFEFLGAPIGDLASTAAHISSRVAGAQALLDAVGELEDLVHSMRCAPPHPQAEAFSGVRPARCRGRIEAAQSFGHDVGH